MQPVNTILSSLNIEHYAGNIGSTPLNVYGANKQVLGVVRLKDGKIHLTVGETLLMSPNRDIYRE